ncbi:hypothetical protein IM792_11965 [Mucilaginibacter sp. JRF]|uniref:hypothetical protein n=1 Tax=Mucilaginibacter sp. JRF TaxID=2780088 RepID=UPI00187F9FA7|nr:hypothetical protein [Mucilaginibacter sp. JRF]MBE9585167.1 hypothetical protein [Mucilaginibacter sp. JRF]
MKINTRQLKRYKIQPSQLYQLPAYKKIKELDNIVIHYATSGYAIDMRCITNNSKFYQKEKPSNHDGKSYKEYALVIDIKDIPLNQEFLIVVEATYWNGFKNPLEEDASTYTDDEIHGLDELGLIIFFPESKPFKSIEKLERNNSTGEENTYRAVDSYYEDKNKKVCVLEYQEQACQSSLPF